MRTLIVKITTLLAVPLATAALVGPAPASAETSSTSASRSATASKPSTPVRILVSYPYRVRAGRVVGSFKIKLINRLNTKTDPIFFAVKFPKNASKVRIYVPKGSHYREGCTRERTRALCTLPGLKKGKSYTLWAKVWVPSSARGKLYGYFGGVVSDTPLDTDPRDLLSEFGDSIRWVKTKSVIQR